MGRAIAEAAATDDEIDITAAFGRSEAGVGGPPDPILLGCDVIVDFSTAAGVSQLATRLALLSAIGPAPAMVIGATGFSPQEDAAVARAADSLPIVRSANFSIAVNVALMIVEQAALRLRGDEWDIEIIEAHHRMKRDAPSGTALMLGAAAARGRKVSLKAVRSDTRQDACRERGPGEIGFASIRAGGIVGEHAVLFAADDELLTISHSARSRSSFARGALLAAKWVRRKPPALYDMADVIADRRG